MTQMQKNEFELMKKLEGYETSVYICTAGKRTVGIGFNMDRSGARHVWNELGIISDFDDVYSGSAEINEQEAYKLFAYDWYIAESAVRTRCIELGVDYVSMPEWKQFILKDIVYNTGSIKKWRKVLVNTDVKDVVVEARRRPHEIMDSRVAKICKHFGICNTIEECKQMGLEYAKYLS